MTRRLLTVAVWLATLAYPLLIHLGTGRLEPRLLAIALLALALLRALLTRSPAWFLAALGALVLVGMSAVSNDILPLKFYPALVNLVLLTVFAATLLRPPSMIERLARRQHPNLSETGVRYTRRVTQVWCAFFIVNCGIALYTAAFASDRIWALYNGMIAYIAMAALFAGEWLLRPQAARA